MSSDSVASPTLAVYCVLHYTGGVIKSGGITTDLTSEAIWRYFGFSLCALEILHWIQHNYTALHYSLEPCNYTVTALCFPFGKQVTMYHIYTLDATYQWPFYI